MSRPSHEFFTPWKPSLPCETPLTPGEHTHEALLLKCRDTGIITQADCEAKVRSLRASSDSGGGGWLAELPTRRHGAGKVRTDMKDQWFSVQGPFLSQAMARAAVKGKMIVHGNNGGEWKCNSRGCKAYMHCNGHKDCPVQLRIQPVDDKWWVQVTNKVQHVLELNHHRRKNSPLTFVLERCVSEGTSYRMGPKQIMEKLQYSLVQSGLHGKRADGAGMEGEPHHHHHHHHPTTTLPHPFAPGMPNQLAKYQRAAARARKASASIEAAVDTVADLERWVENHTLPSDLDGLRHNQIYAVQMPRDHQPEAPCVVLVGKTQVGWLLQLVKLRHRWALHVDGKHKLHDGGWILVTCGTHCVEWRSNAEGKQNPCGVVQAFRPLCYMFSQAHETADSVAFALKAMELVVRMCA